MLFDDSLNYWDELGYFWMNEKLKICFYALKDDFTGTTAFQTEV